MPTMMPTSAGPAAYDSALIKLANAAFNAGSQTSNSRQGGHAAGQEQQ